MGALARLAGPLLEGGAAAEGGAASGGIGKMLSSGQFSGFGGGGGQQKQQSEGYGPWMKNG